MQQERKQIKEEMAKESIEIRGAGDAKITNAADDIVNYFEIHGTVPGSYVAAKSHLCEDIHEEFATRS